MPLPLRGQARPVPGPTLPLTAALLAPVLLAAALTTAPASAARAAVAPAPPAAPASSPARPLLLINGDRLIVTAQGGGTAIALRAARRPDALVTLRDDHQTLEVPAVALPYLDRGLSPALFELGALGNAESGGRLPLRITFTGRQLGHHPAFPGLTVTRSASGVTDGYLTPASAAAFGAALARQYRADHATGRYGTDGLFAGGLTIALAGPTAPAARPPAAHPATHQLTIRATGLRGRPDTGDIVVVYRLDTAELVVPPEIFRHGAARFRVPAGHYCAEAIFSTASSVRDVVLPQFTVHRRPTTVHVTARSATDRLTIRTPRRATADLEEINVIRRGPGGPIELGLAWQGSTGWISPIRRRPSIGTLRTYTHATLVSPRRVSPAYAYDLDFPGPAGVIPAQRFTVRRASLAAVTERYYQDPPTRQGDWLVEEDTPVHLANDYPVVPTRMPAVVTQYLTAGPRFVWQAFSLYITHPDILDWFDGQASDDRAYVPGQRQVEDWNAYPLHPQPDTAFGGPASVFPTQVSAGRIGNRLKLVTSPFSDNQYGHLGPGYADHEQMPITGHYEVDQDGRPIATGSPILGIPAIRLSARPSVVRFTLTAARRFRLFPLSAASQTTWTWHSAPNPSARVPAPWYCAIGRHGPVRQCAAQPMMTLNYRVRGLSLSGQTRPGTQVIEVTAGHIQLGGSAAVTGATARVSFDGGRTWRMAATAAQGGGRFRVSFRAPADVDVTLRVSAHDAVGGSITETITDGYAITR